MYRIECNGKEFMIPAHSLRAFALQQAAENGISDFEVDSENAATVLLLSLGILAQKV